MSEEATRFYTYYLVPGPGCVRLTFQTAQKSRLVVEYFFGQTRLCASHDKSMQMTFFSVTRYSFCYSYLL